MIWKKLHSRFRGRLAGSAAPLPLRPKPADKELLGPTNDTAKHISTVSFTFLVTCVFIAISVSSMTDDRLLIGQDFQLPIFGVTVNLEAFFWIAPVLIVLLHLHLLLLEHVLACKIALLPDPLIQDGVAAFFFPALPLNIFVGKYYNRFVLLLLRVVQFAANVALPLGLLFWIQEHFLPYHNFWCTTFHQILVLADLGLIWYFYIQTTTKLANAKRGSPFIWKRFVPISFLLASATLVLFCIGAIVPATLWEAWTGRAFFFSWELHRNISVHGMSLSRGAPSNEIEALRYQGSLSEEAFLHQYTGLKLAKRDLRRANFTDCQLLNADFRGADLRGANFSRADLRGAQFLPAKEDRRFIDIAGPVKRQRTSSEWRNHDTLDVGRLDNAKFVQADLRGASFLLADLNNASFYGADLRNVEFLGAHLRGSDLEQASLHGAELALADLTGANLQGARLFGASLTGASLLGANFDGAKMQVVDLSDARLQGATFANASLDGSDFRGAQNIGAAFRRASVQGVLGLAIEGVDLSGSAVNGIDRRSISNAPSFTDFRGLDFQARERLTPEAYKALSELHEGAIKLEALSRVNHQRKRTETFILKDPSDLKHRQVFYEEIDRKGAMEKWPEPETLTSVAGQIWSEQAYYNSLAHYLIHEQACQDEHLAIGMAYRISKYGPSVDPDLLSVLEQSIEKELNEDSSCAERQTFLKVLCELGQEQRFGKPPTACLKQLNLMQRIHRWMQGS
jgi:uncharacterized protein YjbI with pentapeptide repeats